MILREATLKRARGARGLWSMRFLACGEPDGRLAECRNSNRFTGGNKMKPSTKDEIAGNVHEVKGKIKEKIGGKIQKKIGQVEKVIEKP